jgi:hypothetical protein
MNNQPTKVYIVIRSGTLKAVYTDNDQLSAVLLDFDDNGTHSPDELMDMEQMYDAVKKDCAEVEYREAHEL